LPRLQVAFDDRGLCGNHRRQGGVYTALPLAVAILTEGAIAFDW
jgi:hypothetical protein